MKKTFLSFVLHATIIRLVRNKSFDFPTATCQMSRSAGLGDLEVRIFGLFFSEVFYDLSLDKGSTLCRTATISFKRKTN